MGDDYWNKLHRMYSDKDWITKPSQFAKTVASYVPTSSTILDLGAGLGQDSAYFASLGHQVTATDLDIDHLAELANDAFSVQKVDLRNKLPFPPTSFDVIYAHLSLHYFDSQTTQRIFSDIHRVLKPQGLLAFFTNSTADPEYNTGTMIEPNYFEIEGTPKRYFTVTTATRFAQEFKVLLADNNGETYKDSAKGIHHLIRFIGQKVN